MSLPWRTDNSDAESLAFDVVDLVGKPGSHRREERSVTSETAFPDISSMKVPAGEPVTVEVELESVGDGIYATGTVSTELHGECSRCLDPVEQPFTARIGELFVYPNKAEPGDDESPQVTDDYVDLSTTVFDLITLESEDRPLCKPDCLGLCPQCGKRMEEDPDHTHAVLDERWAALAALLPESEAPDEESGKQ